MTYRLRLPGRNYERLLKDFLEQYKDNDLADEIEYDHDRVSGWGVFGDVFEGIWCRNGMAVAVKRLRANPADLDKVSFPVDFLDDAAHRTEVASA